MLMFTLAACSGTDPVELGQTQQPVAAISVTPITWNVVGLDSNNVTTGPAEYAIGVRIRNTGDVTATNVVASFAFTTANANINTLGPTTRTFASLAPGATVDAYFDIAITRTAAAKNTARRYLVTVTGTNFTAATSPTPREIFVENLVSQQRNETLSITGPTSVSVGDVVQYVLVA